MLIPRLTPPNEKPPRWTGATTLDSSCNFETQGMPNDYHIVRARRKVC